MKKSILLSILLVLCLSFQASAFNPLEVMGGKKASAPTYPDIILDMNAEGTWSAGTSYTADGTGECAEDTSGAINSAFVEETGSPLSGSSSFTWDTNYDFCTFDFTTSMTKGRIGSYLKIDLLAAGTEFLKIYNTAAPLGRIGFVMAASSYVQVLFFDGTTTVSDVISTTAVGTVAYVEVAWDSTVGDGSDYVKIYVNGVLEDSSTALTLNGMDFTNFYPGNTGDLSGDATIDRVRISTDPLRDLNALKTTDILSGACP